MNTNELAMALLGHISLNLTDVARLVPEAHDYLGDMVTEKSRTEVLAMLRSVIRYGTQTLREEGCTVSLREAVRSSLKRTEERPAFRDMKFSLSIMLYCCVRPMKITRIQPADIDWEEQHLIMARRCRAKEKSSVLTGGQNGACITRGNLSRRSLSGNGSRA